MQIAIIAGEKKKELMTQFCIAYCGILSKHDLCATGTTGKYISDATGLEIECLLSGSQGGAEQVASRISYDEIDLLLFFRDSDYNFENDKMEEIVSLIRKYDCQGHVYFMTSSDRMIKKVSEYAPDIPVCVGWDGNKEDPMSLTNRAIALGAYKIQLFKPYFNEETIKKAHAHGILCNLFWADDPQEAKKYFEMGVDTVLTNNYLAVYNGTRDILKN